MAGHAAAAAAAKNAAAGVLAWSLAHAGLPLAIGSTKDKHGRTQHSAAQHVTDRALKALYGSWSLGSGLQRQSRQDMADHAARMRASGNRNSNG